MLENRGWSAFWIRNARRASERRRERFGIDPPRPVARLLRTEKARVGLLPSLRLALYAVFGSPRQMLALLWRHLTDRDTPKRILRIEALASELRSAVSPSCRVVDGYLERRLYSRDLARVPRLLETLLHRTTPQLVVQPRREDDLAKILRFAGKHSLPVYPRGVSSSAFGGAVPTLNGVTLDLSSMMEILDIDALALTARVQAGVRWADLAERLRPLGLAPLATPSSRFSTVAGWAASGGLGIESFGFGPMAQAIVRARVALMNGTVLDLDQNDPALKDFLGTEGQFGVISELTIRVRKRPPASRPRLLLFPDGAEAFAFLDRLVESGRRPSHVAYYDPSRLAEENLMFRDRPGSPEGTVVPEKDAVLLHFDDPKKERAFLEDGNLASAGETAPDAAAHYLWAERFFPMKFQRIGPGMLAAEVLLPRARVPTFLQRARTLAKRFGNELAAEVFVCRPGKSPIEEEDRDCVVIASFRVDPRRKLDYFLRLLLVQLLVHIGVKTGGRPYGFGIWNSPFLHRGVPVHLRKRLVARKLELDPALLLNPMKFFRVRTRLFNLPGLIFLSPVFGFTLGTLRFFSPLVGALARLLGSNAAEHWAVPDPAEDGGTRLLEETALRCVFCGACVSCCPAYRLTGDERSTGRGKLRLVEALARSETLRPEDRQAPFRCLHCGLCEEVCQAGLPLTDCYEALENRIENAFGRPAEAVEAFAAQADRQRDWILETFGLRLAPWTPGERLHPLPAPKTPGEGGGR